MATIETAGNMITAMEVAYPAVYQNMDGRKVEAQIKLWAEMFRDVPDSILEYAVKLYISNDTSGFPPSIGKINDIIRESQGPELTETEAWEMVKHALRNSCDYESALEEWGKLPEEVRAPIPKATTLIEWSNLPSDTVNTSVAARYCRSYTEKRRREREIQALPHSVRKLLPMRSWGECD